MSECGPSILWSVMPLELVLEGLTPPWPARSEVVVEGRILEVEHGAEGAATVVRLISARPDDYLNPRFQPGVRLDLGRESV